MVLVCNIPKSKKENEEALVPYMNFKYSQCDVIKTHKWSLKLYLSTFISMKHLGSDLNFFLFYALNKVKVPTGQDINIREESTIWFLFSIFQVFESKSHKPQ